MAQNPNESATIGTVTAIVGEVKATGTDGVERILSAGDTVAAGEVIETSANGAVHIQLANGRALECGPRFSGTLNPGLLDLASGTRIALDGSIINPAVAATPAPGDIATTPATPGTTAIPQDIAALQAAIAGGADPSRIAEASAAGGAAPGAGGADGGGGTPLLIEQANSQGQVTSGIDGGGGKPLGFPDLTTTQLATIPPAGPPSTPPPVISVDLTGIRLVPPPGSDPETPPETVTVSGNIVSLVEGTSPGADPGKILNFVLVLDKASDVDVVVTYTITALGEQNDIDLVDLLGGTVIVHAGETQVLVPIKIFQDHDVESDDRFQLVITGATNAVINPDASTAILTIINDDVPPTISVNIPGIHLEPPPGSDPGTPPESVTVSGNVVSVVEGTSPGADPGKILNFLLVLDKPSSMDVEVSYTITALAPESDIDLVDLFGGKIVVHAGETQVLVPIRIAQDHHVETDEGFQLVITGATNAVINPDASTAILNVINDDAPPLAGNDAYTVSEGENGESPLPSVLSRVDAGETGDDSGADAGETLTVTTTGTITTAQGGHVVMNADGTFRYFTPNAEFSGADSFTYKMTDGFNGESQATVTINVTSIDDLPDAVNNSYNVNEDSTLTITAPGLLGNDTVGGDGGTLAVTSFTQPAHGTLTLNPNGSFTYTPTANYNGPDSFTYTIEDADGDTDTATVSLTVNPVNDLPNAVDNAYSVNEDSALVLTAPGILGNDTVGGDGGTLAVTSFTQPAHGTLLLNANGSFTYTPTANYNGPDSFTYTIEDADGDTDTATVSLTVNPVNDLPDAVNNSYSVNEDSTLTITAPGLLGNDTVGGDGGTLAVTSFTQPAYGTLTLNPNGSFTYTPTANYNGPDSFTYTIEDADGDTDTATVSLTVNPVDDLPDAVNNSYSVNEDAVLTITAPGLLGNDTTGGDGGVLAVTSFTQPSHGTLTLNADGGFTYTPAANYNGQDSFTYTIEDADGDTDTATVAITVNPVDDAPNINVTSAPGEVSESALPGGSAATATESFALSATPATTTTGSLQVGDPDGLASVTHLNINNTDYSVAALADGETLQGSNGTLVISYVVATGVVSYEYTLTTPAFDQPGSDEQEIFEVKVKDNTGRYSDPATIAINIFDDSPVINSVANITVQNNAGAYAGTWIPVSGADGYNANVAVPNVSSAEGINITLTNPPSLVQASSTEDKFDGAGNYVGELYTAYIDAAKTKVFFTLLMKVDGTYVFDLVEPNPKITTTETLNLSGSIGGFGDFLYAEKIASKQHFPDPKTDIKFIAHQDYAGDTNLGIASNVNTSTNGIGVSDSGSGGGIHTKLNESLTLVFLRGDSDTNGDTHPADSAIQPVDSVKISFHVDANHGSNPVNDDVAVRFVLHLEDGSTEMQNAPGNGIADDGSYTVASTSGKQLLSVDVINVDTDGDTFLLKSAEITITTTELPADLALNFSAQIVDGDGDVSATAAFTVSIDTNNSMSSTSGNDIMYSDTAVSDTLVWHAGDTGADTVVNFATGPAQDLSGTGDTLDLADILQGESGNAGSLVSFLSFSSNGTDTTISVDADGALNGQSTAQTIVLKGVDLTAGGTMDATAIIGQLLADHNLKTS